MQHPNIPGAALRAVLIATALAGAAGAATAQASALERGAYLVTTIMACGNCHTPKDAEGRPVAGKELAGGSVTFDLPPYAGVAANITPDRETGIGAWSDDEIKRAITHGERPNHGPNAGKPLGPPMAANFFKALLPSDLDAIVAVPAHAAAAAALIAARRTVRAARQAATHA